ncbi:PRC-barrel domain-containing protein [Collinsella sp. AM20-15AC]|uniref:PRC-barrel domain-containing protein n=1 Tax=Collinsella sp. AM20-15AC TaxID=2292029 RepID=UPI00351AA992
MLVVENSAWAASAVENFASTVGKAAAASAGPRGCTVVAASADTAVGTLEDIVVDTAGRILAVTCIGADTLAGMVGNPFAGRLPWLPSAAWCRRPGLSSAWLPAYFASWAHTASGDLAQKKLRAVACVPWAAASAAPS